MLSVLSKRKITNLMKKKIKKHLKKKKNGK